MTTSTQILFIDAAVLDVDTLLASVDPSIEVVRLAAGRDGLTQIAEALAARSDVAAVHIVSHGTPGALTLGGTAINEAALATHAAELQTIHDALGDGADLLLYGCDVGAGDAGASFLSALAAATGADVAASDDATGAARLGGDWALEARTGTIEAAPLDAPSYDALLAYGSGGIFDNQYVKFGWSTDGSFGYGSNKTPGIFYDSAGTGNYPANADFLTPGSPFEFFAVKIGSSTYVNNNTSYTSPQMATTTDTSGVVSAGGKTYGTLKFVSTVGGLEITQTYTLGATDQVISINVSVKNTTGSTIYGVKYARGIDPDVDSPLGTTATQNVRGATGIAASDIVLGTGPISSHVIGLYTNSSVAHNTSISPGWSTDPNALLANSSNNQADSTINLAFDLGDIAAGQTKNFSLAYVFAASAAALAESVAQVPQSNPAPTLTDFAAPVDTVLEDGTVELTFAELAAQGNEADVKADGTPGTVNAFVVKAISGGTLKIGTSAGTATAWAAATNDVINDTLKAYWTPAANANGTLNAFTVVARDAEGAVSATPVPVRVIVTPVNDAPVLASNAALPDIAEDAAVNNGSSVAALFAPRFSDPDAGSSLGGIVVVGNAADPAQGQWQYSTDGGSTWHDVGAVTASSGLALSAGTLVRFAPVADYHGTPGSLTVHAADNAYAGGYSSGATRVRFDTTTDAADSGVSVGSRTLSISVSSVNDAPVFASAAPATIALSETASHDASAVLSSGSLTGTLAASDVDHATGTLTFAIRGGAESAGTFTRAGLYGTLTLDKATGAWSYAPTNMAALNALAEGATATETFTFKVIDPLGAESLQTLTVTLTGTNDLPVLAAAIADQTYGGTGLWTFQVPAGTFTDAEGLPLAYSATLGDGSPLPVWLSFDAAARTFSGTPPLGTPWPLALSVTATDSEGVAVSDTFAVTLTPPAASPDGAGSSANHAPTAGHDRVMVAQGTTEKVLTLADFGHYHDADGDALAAIRITGVTGTGSLQYDDPVDGWTPVTAGTDISAADIAAGKLKFVTGGSTGNDIASIGFQVGDGSDFSAAGYSLAVDAAAATSVTGTSVTTAAAGAWTSVYAGVTDVVGGFGSAPSVRVVVEATHGTIRLGSASGVTVITTGYGNATDGTATSIAIEGTQAQVNAALATLQANRSSGSMTLDIRANIGGTVANPANGHYYEVVAGPAGGISWTDARDAAAAKSFNGLQGYLATITSADENAFIKAKLPSDAWIGASDASVEGVWRWVTGPEAGDLVSGTYTNWNPGEPNNQGDEDYAEFYGSGGRSGQWNDLPNSVGASVQHYVVEYGGMPGDTPTYAPASRLVTLGATVAPVLAIDGSAAYAENAAPVRLNPTLAISDLDSTTLYQATVQITGGRVSGDVLAFANDGSTMGNIAAVYNAGTGTLTLQSSGSTATLAQWEAALKAVTFHSTSDDPGSATRTVSWTVNDGTDASAAGTTSVTVAPVNDAPVAAHLADVTVAAGTPLSLNIGSPFTDPEGDAITYSATLANGDPLPDWLSFDAATHVFSGNPPAGTPYLNLTVTGTDAHGAAASTGFMLSLTTPSEGTSAANNAGAVTVTGTPTQGHTLTAQAPTDADGVVGSVTYQWQVSGNGGSTWTDITGSRGQATTLTLAESEAGKQVRVQAFYNDAGGAAEAPVSSAVAVANVNDAGVAGIAGVGTPGATLTATLSDPDGLAGATPAYQWQVSSNGGSTWTDIAGATYSAYTLANDDGGKQVRVRIGYTDDHGTAEVAYSSSTAIQFGLVAPVAGNTVGSATEAGGVNNAIAGSDASGNLLASVTDVNVGETHSITGLRAGATEGLGRPATVDGGFLVLTGDYGTLRVNVATGAYVYEVAQDNASVQAARPGVTLSETFNYTVTDSNGLSDTATLSINIAGANDAPTLSGIAATATVAEDVPTALPLELAIADPDPVPGGAFRLRLHVDAGTLRALSSDSGVTITGSDTGTLVISADTPLALQGWLADNDVFYVSAPNAHGTGVAALTYAIDDGSGSFAAMPGTTAITSEARNDPAVIDLGGAGSAGNDFTATFRPRGGEVAVVAGDVTISDIDPSDTLAQAVVTLAGGAYDNDFGVTYETLRSSAGSSFAGSLGTIAITGNGSGAHGLTGATQLTFTGAGTQADYQDALKTVTYNNTNPNAFSGDRTITISVSDAAGQASNAASFATAAPNALIAVGQRIFIDGVDSGFTVAQVIDTQHFVASGPLTALAPGAALSLRDGTGVVTTATQAGPVVATTTVEVPWTPVIDMSGELLAGRDHAVTYTEGQAGVAIATSDASITDQDGNIASVVVTLTNPVDGAAEQLFIGSALVTQLATLGITVTGSGTHAITLAGSKDATFFQIGLRGIQYVNTSDHPDVATQRVVAVAGTDVDGNTGVGAQTTINLLAVNDAPSGTNATLTTPEDTARVLAVADFGFTDVDGNGLAAVVVASLPGTGSLTLDGVAVTAGQRVGVADIVAGKLQYLPAADASGNGIASFTFRVQDDGGTARGGVDLAAAASTLSFNVTPANDAPVITPAAPVLAAIDEDAVANAGQRVSTLVGSGPGQTGVADVDALNNGGAGFAPEAVGQGIAIHTAANAGGTWQYSTDDGASWTAVGAVSEASALLLRSSDRVRFVPDTHNATSASVSYHLWDGASGSAGTKVDASVRGGSSAFSTGSDTASITVTPLNDAPTVDLNGAGGGSDGTAIFRPRGDAVAVVGDDAVIADVDAGDTLVSATVTLTGGALDNLFGTTYETLSSTAGASFAGSLGAIAISGNGSGAHGLVGATQLSLAGAGTHADYLAALKTVRYDNANPNAYSGDRTVQISVRDASASTGEAGDALDSAVATATIQVPWTPVVDMNGDAAAGRNASVVFTEGTAGVAIAASDASIVDQDGNIKRVVVTLTNPLDGAAEKLFIAAGLVTQLATVGITVSGNHSHAITLSGNKDGTTFQLALRAIQYVNSLDHADATPRVVTVGALDMQDNVGVGAQTVINLVDVNDAPQGVDGAVTLDEDTPHVFAVADFGYTDLEGHALQSVVVTTLPGTGALTLDGVAVTAGQEVAAADITAGKLIYTPVLNAHGAPAASLTFQVRDAGGTTAGGVDFDATPNTLVLNITPVNDLPTGTVTTNAPSVSISGDLREGQTLTAHFDVADVDYSPSEITAATSYQWQTRVVPSGTWTDIAGATAHLHVLGSADVSLEVRVVVSYADTLSSTLVYTSDISAHPAIVGDVNGDIVLAIDTPDPVLIVHPAGDVTVTNTGSGPVTIEGLPDGGTVTVSTAGPVTVSNPAGDLTVVNAGPGTVTITGLDDGAQVTTSGPGTTVIANPEGSVVLDNQGPGSVVVSGLNDGETLDVHGAGNTTLADPDGDVVIHNAGPGTVNVTGLSDGAQITTAGNGPVTITDPLGDVTLDNQGPGAVTISGLNDGETLDVHGAGNTTLANPDGDVVIHNAGPGTVNVTGLTDGASVTTAGNGPVTITDPLGDVTLDNQGPGTVTVSGLNDGQTLDAQGAGPTTLADPDGDVVIHNAGPGTVNVTGLTDDASVTTSGNGPVTLADPLGGVALDNQGPGTVTITGLNAGETLDVHGAGPTTLADPDGDLVIHNAGPGTVTATGVNDGASVTTSGSGPITVAEPEGSLALVNQGPGTVTVSGLNAGQTLDAQGAGPTTLADPDGDLVIHNAGPGTVTATGVNDGASVTTSGSGPITVAEPEGSLALVNQGPGTVTVSGLNAGQTLDAQGAGPTTLADPDGDLVIHNAGPGTVTATGVNDGSTVTTSGSGPIVVGDPDGSVVLATQGPGTVTVSGLNDGQTLHASGSGPVSVAALDGDAVIDNAGPATLTVTGAAPGSTLRLQGSGPQVLDLAAFPPGAELTLDNATGAPLPVLHAPDGATLHASGAGDLAIAAPLGDLHVHNAGTGTVHVDQVADGVTVTKTGSGPAVIDHPVGGFTLVNDAAGLVTVNHLGAGQTLVTGGTGPVALASQLALGEHVTVDVRGNGNVQLSNTGAGTIDVLGDLQLDAGDPVRILLGGDDTTALAVTGSVALDGTPLQLQLGDAFAARLAGMDLGDTITLLDNDGSDAVTGTFAGLPEGAPLMLGGQLFRISYAGGSGNDVVLTRANDAPTGTVSLSGTPTQGQTLTASHALGDTDGLGTISYRWLADGALLAVGSSYVITQAAVGKAITVVASYTDGEGTVESVSSAPTAPVANVNDAPTGAVLITGTPSLGQTLVATHTLADIDGLGAVSYQWLADGVAIAGATGASLVLGRDQIGKTITTVAHYTDAWGTAEQVGSAATAVVADGSNVPREVESQVPGLGSGGVAGDGNGDGVADTLQPGVASTTTAGGSAPSSFVTLVIDSIDGKVREGSTDRLVTVTPTETADDVPSWAQTPAGWIDFTAEVDQAGATKTFSLYVDKDLGVNGYWAKDAQGVLVNLASEAYGGRMVVEGDKLRLDFQITEGGEFDHSAAGDHTIVAEGAAGHAELSLIGYTVDTPAAVAGLDMWD